MKEGQNVTPSNRKTFKRTAADAAIAWKQKTSALPEAARKPSPYCAHPDERPSALCLPVEYAVLNLLPDARQVALDRFDADGIRWHGATDRPNNHLLSSQVQCLNALVPMVTGAAAIVGSFGSMLDIAKVLPFDPDGSRPDDRLVFEWIGKADYLDEGHGKPRTRGHKTTSTDAAIRYRTSTGAVEIALIEWKYTESYDGAPLTGGEEALRDRHERYRRLWDDPAGPLRREVIPYQDLFVEPFYQLMRQQLLAHEMERTGELGAERVRIVYAAPAANTELWASLTRMSHHQAGDHIGRIWRSMLRRPDDFVLFDTARLVAPDASSSGAFRDRYGHIASV